ncbi:MAG: hypothetical protein WCK29_00675 [archaeon]
MSKKGQLQISFGIIFSIIIIAATLAVAGYIIVQFIQGQNNINCKLYVQDLQNKINDAWGSDGSISNVFTDNNIPPKTTKICFGGMNQTLLNIKDKPTLDAVSNRVRSNVNVVFYPPASCGDGQFSFTLLHAKMDGFFCVDISAGKANVKYAKGVTDAIVKICPVNSTCTIGDSIVANNGSISGIIAPGSF